MGKRTVMVLKILLAVFVAGSYFPDIPSNASEDAYVSFIGKVWVADDLQLASRAVQPVSFVFTEMEDGSIGGYIRFGYSLAEDYFDGSNLFSKASKFYGTVGGNMAECFFTDEDGETGKIRFLFLRDGRAEVALDYGQEDEGSYLCRPLNLKDYAPVGEVSCTETEMEPWGKVNVVSFAYPYGEMHMGMPVLLTDGKDDVLYKFWGYQINGTRVFDVFIEDLDGDGLEDVKVITGLWYGDREYELRFERNYYQTENRLFQGAGKEEIPVLEDGYRGCYRIEEFLPTLDYPEVCKETMTIQEKDMMLGRIVVLEEEYGITYDCERRQGLREWRYIFSGNQMIQGFETEGRDRWKAVDSGMMRYLAAHGMEKAIGRDRYRRINGVIFNPTLETVRYYTMEGTDDLIMESSLTGQYFLLEKLAREDAEEWERELVERKRDVLNMGGVTEEETVDILTGLYGTYTVREFLPTRYYEGKFPGNIPGNFPESIPGRTDAFLPDGEPGWMIGKEITIGEDVFTTYDNYRWSEAGKGKEAGKWFQKVRIQEPDYRLTRRARWEIFGLRDDMLPEDMEQEEYMEIDVYPGIKMGDDRYLPQLFLLDDGRILMYSMGQYFLLEKDG